MGNAPTEFMALVAEHRLYAARDALRALEAAGARVYGLAQNIEQVEEAIAKVEQIIADGAKLQAERRPRKAYSCFREATRRITDHPDLESKLEDARATVKQARELMDQAKAEYADDNWERSLELLNESLSLDADSKSGIKLRKRLTGLVGTARVNRRYNRFILALGACAILLTTGLVVGIFKLENARNNRSAHRKALVNEVEVLISRGEQYIANEEFTQAEASFSQAMELISDIDESPPGLDARVEAALASEPMTKGMAGLVPLDGRWMSPEGRKVILPNVRSSARTSDCLWT